MVEQAASVEGARMQAAIERRLFATSPAPVRIGRFVLVDVLGRGGMGTVYRAFDPDLDRVVAIKLLHATADAREARLLREARTLARLNHPHVVSIYEIGRQGEQLFLAMEYVEGGSLAQWCAREQPGGRARTLRALELFEQATRGLIAAHAAGIVHRDLKPGNILVGADGRARLVDFGLARADPEAPRTLREAAPATPPLAAITAETAVVGTPGYIAPEQLAGQADERSDQFSLCVTFFEALYGVRPEAADAGPEGAALHRIAASRGRHVPPAVREVLLRGMARAPGGRFPSATALLAALVRARRGRRWPWLLAGAALAALAWGAFAREAAGSCAADVAALQPAWGEARRTAVHAALAASGAPFAASTWARVEHALDQTAARWLADDLAACRQAHDRDPALAAAGRARRACSQRAARTFAHATAALTGLGADISRAIHLVDALADLVDCRAPVEVASQEAMALALALDRAQVAERLGRFDEVVARARAVLGATRAGELPRLRAAAHGLLAGVCGYHGEHGPQLAHERAGLGEAERADDPGDQARAWGELATHAARAGDLDGARFYLERARRFAREGRLDPRERARLAWKEGLVEHWSGRHEAAAGPLERAVAMFREAAPGGLELAAALADLAEARMLGGPAATAIAAGAESVALVAGHLGADHPEAAVQRARAARIYSFAQDEARTEAELLAALPVLEANPWYLPAVRAELHDQLAQTRDNLGRFDAALADIDRALALTAALVGPGSPALALQMTTRGRILAHAGQLDAAAAQLDRALAQARVPGSYTDLNVGEVQLERADLLAARGRPAEARAALAEAQAHLGRAYAPSSDAGLQARGYVGRVLVALGDLDEARALLTAAVRDAESVAADAWVGRLRLELARAARAGGDVDEARRLATASREALLAAGVPDAGRAEVDELLRELAGD